MTADPLRFVRVWLLGLCAMIVAMVALGGITRLTDSGLSLVTWEPILGAVPPRNGVEWQARFEQYQATPEFQKKNRAMTLAQFKWIFFWEYLHRLWGRLIGAAYLGPGLYFLARRRLGPGLAWKLAAGFLLLALQGYAGWFMVKSGLVNEPRVSPYRLAIHLMLALALLGWLWRLALGLRLAPPRAAAPAPLRAAAWAILGGIALQTVYGAFMAGLDAGGVSDTWPKMLGRWAPAGLFAMKPPDANLTQNPLTVHFIHRWLAVIAAGLVVGFWTLVRRRWPDRARPAAWAAGLVALQMGLGVATVLLHVAIPIAVAHQVNGCLLVMAWVSVLAGLTGGEAWGEGLRPASSSSPSAHK